MPKAQPTLVDNFDNIHEVKQCQFPVRGEPTTLIINGQEIEGRRTSWRDLKYTYFRIDGGQFFVAGHLDDEVTYSIAYPEGFAPTQFKNDRVAMAARTKELKALKAAEAPAAGPDDEDGEEPDDGEPAEDATPVEKPKRGRRKAVAEQSAAA